MRFESGSDEAFDDQRTQPPSASEDGNEAFKSTGLVTLLDKYYSDENE